MNKNYSKDSILMLEPTSSRNNSSQNQVPFKNISSQSVKKIATDNSNDQIKLRKSISSNKE